MKLTPQQKKIFAHITALNKKFLKVTFIKKDLKEAELLGNHIKTKCDYFLRLYNDQEAEKTRFYSVNEYNQKQQNEYEIKAFINDKKDFINNVLGGTNENY